MMGTVTRMAAMARRRRHDGRAGPDARWCAVALGFVALASIAQPAIDTGDDDAVRRRAAAMIEAAAQASNTGRAADADRIVAEACAVLDARFGPRDGDALECERSRILFWSTAGEYRRALDAAEALLARRRAELGPDDRHTLAIESDLGLFLMNTGDLERSIATHRHALDARTRALGERDPHTLDSVANLAQALAEAGLPAQGLPYNRRAYELSREVLGAKHRDTLITGINLGINLNALGRLDEALALNEEVYVAARSEFGDDDIVTISALQSISVNMDEIGRHEEALAVKERLFAALVRTRGPGHPRTISNAGNLAFSYLALGMKQKGLDTARRAMEAGRRAFGPAHLDTVYVQGRYAQALCESGRTAECAALLDATIALAKTLLAPTHALLHDLALRRWEALHGSAAPDAAALAELLAIVAAQRDALGEAHPARFPMLEALARAEERAGDIDAAIATRRRLRDQVEQQRLQRALPREVRRSQLARAATGYKTLARLELRAGDDAAAFASGEMAKGRTLLDSLAARRADRAGIVPAADADRLAEFDARLAALDNELVEAPPADQRPSIEARRNALAREAAAFRVSLAERYPKYRQLNAVPPVDVADRLSLPRGASYLGYLVADGRVLGWVVPRDGRPVGRDLGDATTLFSAIRTWRALVTEGAKLPAWRLPDGRFEFALLAPAAGAVRVQGAEAVGRHLAGMLLAPFARELSRSRVWIVSPDDLIAALPLEPLPWQGGHVVDRHELRYVQSLAVHRLLVERHRAYRSDRSRAPLLAVGAARYGVDITDPSPGADTMASAAQSAGGSVARAFDRVRMKWPDLPASEREVDGVAALFGGADVLKREAASEDRLIEYNRRGRLRAYRYLLFSAHGYLSTTAPLTSAIVLDQRVKSAASDGYVTAAEWTGYALASDLVVLSACETGLGGLVPGEGIVGLPYALFVAGNADAVVTLWPVIDGSTAELVQRFFRRVAAGESHASALAAVKRELARRSKGSPLAWAGFVLYGAR